MQLNDVRKFAVRGQWRVRFTLSNGMEGQVTEQGVCRVDGLTGIPGFNLEEEFARAERFLLEPVGIQPKGKPSRKSRTLSRPELEQMVAAMDGAVSAAET